jgi:hypothetical protein
VWTGARPPCWLVKLVTAGIGPSRERLRPRARIASRRGSERQSSASVSPPRCARGTATKRTRMSQRFSRRRAPAGRSRATGWGARACLRDPASRDLESERSVVTPEALVDRGLSRPGSREGRRQGRFKPSSCAPECRWPPLAARGHQSHHRFCRPSASYTRTRCVRWRLIRPNCTGWQTRRTDLDR